jgi:hypothetical protein
VENDVEEVMQEEDSEIEGYFEKKSDIVEKDNILQWWGGYFKKLEYHHPHCSTVKQSMRNKILVSYLYGTIG